ncbi:MAG TPA: glutaredoxin 3 [Anaeromyxobacteraceae bacterium]|nr:glutaredoxin 3 [Anaeromyxobacteraceae bacterium]
MRVVVYTKSGCPYSAGAKRLLEEKGIAFEEVNVSLAPERRAELRERAPGARTLPQVFFGDRHVGGYTELQELDRRSGLRTGVLEAARP